MKFLDKLVLKIFSIIILIVTVGIILIMTGLVDPERIVNQIAILTDGENAIKRVVGTVVNLKVMVKKELF